MSSSPRAGFLSRKRRPSRTPPRLPRRPHGRPSARHPVQASPSAHRESTGTPCVQSRSPRFQLSSAGWGYSSAVSLLMRGRLAGSVTFFAMSASAAPFDMARALVGEGRLADAEQLMVRELQATEQKYGRGSPEWASAQCDLGNVLLGGNQAKRAVECFRRACSGPMPERTEARKDRLTYQLNLGFVLTMTGRLDEAETELRRNVQERLAFYGREHPGY